MDIDRFVVDRRDGWERLAELTRTARRGAARLTDVEADELVVRYLAASADLATAQARLRDPALIATLSAYVADANGVIYRPRAQPGATLADFFRVRVPGAIWSSRRPIGVVALLFFAIAIASGVWVANDQTARDTLIDPDTQRLVAAVEFEEYYSSDAAQNFASQVTVNNIQVAFLAYITGAMVALPTLFIVGNNALNVGVMAGVMHANDAGAKFWGLITPHGLLEISAILVAGGLGAHLGWALVAAGDAPRRTTFARTALRSVDGIVGLALAFVAAGLIEGFVTGSGLPTGLRVAVGVIAELCAVAYVVLLGPPGEAELTRRGTTRYVVRERHRAPDALASR